MACREHLMQVDRGQPMIQPAMTAMTAIVARVGMGGKSSPGALA
jgi:hypothetical protein